MYLQTQSSLTLFALGSFDLSAALNKTAFILTCGFLFYIQAGFVCKACRFPWLDDKHEILQTLN